jgi:hypothetical protein
MTALALPIPKNSPTNGRRPPPDSGLAPASTSRMPDSRSKRS